MTASPVSFPFRSRNPALGGASLAPLLPFTLSLTRSVSLLGLLDTGAALNVLPYAVGVQLGAVWDQQTTTVPLAGNLAAVEARALAVDAVVVSVPVRLGFAWAKTDDIPILLGQVNFFMEFDVCFFRSAGRFEVKPKGP